MSAAEAHRLGLVNRVVPAADLMAEAKKLAAALAAKAPIAVRYILEAVNKGLEMPFAAGPGLRGDAVRPGGEHRRHARRHRGVSREAQAGVQGQLACARQDAAAGAAAPTRRRSASRVIVSRFNETVTGSLRDAATAALDGSGRAPTVQVLDVPGAFEIPQAARAAAESGRFDAIVCLGCIIRGETPHFDYIASAVAHGITDAAGETGVPMAFGVLNDGYDGAGDGAVGTGPRQQRPGSGGGRDRDGGPL